MGKPLTLRRKSSPVSHSIFFGLGFQFIRSPVTQFQDFSLEAFERKKAATRSVEKARKRAEKKIRRMANSFRARPYEPSDHPESLPEAMPRPTTKIDAFDLQGFAKKAQAEKRIQRIRIEKEKKVKSLANSFKARPNKSIQPHGIPERATIAITEVIAFDLEAFERRSIALHKIETIREDRNHQADTLANRFKARPNPSDNIYLPERDLRPTTHVVEFHIEAFQRKVATEMCIKAIRNAKAERENALANSFSARPIPRSMYREPRKSKSSKQLTIPHSPSLRVFHRIHERRQRRQI